MFTSSPIECHVKNKNSQFWHKQKMFFFPKTIRHFVYNSRSCNQKRKNVFNVKWLVAATVASIQNILFLYKIDLSSFLLYFNENSSLF